MSDTETANQTPIVLGYHQELPFQHQDHNPGVLSEMTPQPAETRLAYKRS